MSDGMAEPVSIWWVFRMSGVQSPGIIQVSVEKTTTFFIRMIIALQRDILEEHFNTGEIDADIHGNYRTGS